MKRSIDKLSILNMLFILILGLSGSVSGTGGQIIYYLAFAIPITIGFTVKLDGEERAKIRLYTPKKSIGYTLPFVAPFILAVLALSSLTALLLGLFGFENTTDVSGNLFTVALKHAVLPALLEEALFRFLPLMLLARSSEKNALFHSSVAFALIHCNLFQIPYALFAGAVLASLTLLSGSILPAVILHFLNNMTSILLMRYENSIFYAVFFSLMGFALFLSAVYIFFKRKEYISDVKAILGDKCKLEFTFSELLFVFATLLISIFNLAVNI